MPIMQNYNDKKYQGGGIDMATFGELLQELRKDHRLSQKQLADVIAVTTGTVSNYENNQHLPDIEKLIMLADYFGVTTDYLLGRSISRLPPDIFEEQLVPGKTMSSILNDFRKLSPDRKNTILSLMKDMEAGMMLSQYVKKEQA